MSIITNTRFTPGQTLDAVALNTKMTDIVTATTSGLSGLNLRNEAVDLPNCDYDTNNGESGIILTDARQQTNGVGVGAGTAYENTADVTLTELAHGSGTRITYGPTGLSLVDGDLLRYTFGALCTDFSGSRIVAPGTYVHPCWVVWVQWDITSAALTDWVAVPGQGDWDNAYTDVANTHGESADNTLSTAVIPHGSAYDDGSANQYHYHNNFSLRRVYNYIEAGGGVTIYGIRLVIDGLYYPWYTAGTAINRLVHRDSDPTAGDFSVTMNGAYAIALIMRTS